MSPTTYTVHHHDTGYYCKLLVCVGLLYCYNKE